MTDTLIHRADAPPGQRPSRAGGLTRIQVYEKYVHLDQCLSDRAWLGESILSQILFDLWQAIREEEEWKKEKKG